MQPPNPNPNPQFQTHTPMDPNSKYYHHPNTVPHYPSYYPPHHLQPQNPNPNPCSNPIPNYPQNPVAIDPYNSTNLPYYTAAPDTGLNPPGVDPYASLGSYPQSYSHGGLEVQQPGGVAYAHYQSVSVESMAVNYYSDPNAGTTGHNWAVAEAVNPYVTVGTLPSNGTKQVVHATQNSVSWSNPTIRPKGTWKRAPKTKVVQSAWCEVCKVCCDTKDVLDLHKLGKKHKKNLEKLHETSIPAPVLVASASAENPVIGPPENPVKSGSVSGKKAAQSEWCEVCKVCCDTKDVLDLHKSGKKHKKNLEKLKEASMPALAIAGLENPVIGPSKKPAKSGSVSGQKSKKKAADSPKDLETKRRKVLEGGAAAAAVKTCSVCNVVCNSETVFQHHLAGQKHIALMKKLASGMISIPTAT